MKIALVGYGKMGKAVEKIALAKDIQDTNYEYVLNQMDQLTQDIKI
jgi:6-phosphogluconate dehydrogenase (decarboxylating)